MKTEKQIGEFHVSIDGSTILIAGEYNSNWGRIYDSEIDRYKRHPEGEKHDWNRPQIIGMEWEYGLVPAVTKWIHSKILA